MTKMKIDFIPRKRIERVANEILQEAESKGFYNFNQETPVDLICEKLNLTLYYEDLTMLGSDVLGCCDFSSNIIFLNNTQIDNSKEYDARERFTIGHELGHYMLHKKIYEEKPEFITMFHDETEDYSCQDILRNIEWQANYFSACILMPAELVKEKWKQLEHKRIQDKVNILKRFFCVSMEAMQIRLCDLKLIP